MFSLVEHSAVQAWYVPCKRIMLRTDFDSVLYRRYSRYTPLRDNVTTELHRVPHRYTVLHSLYHVSHTLEEVALQTVEFR